MTKPRELTTMRRRAPDAARAQSAELERRRSLQRVQYFYEARGLSADLDWTSARVRHDVARSGQLVDRAVSAIPNRRTPLLCRHARTRELSDHEPGRSHPHQQRSPGN